MPLLHFPVLAAHDAALLHAVTTRHGGISTGPYASLNLSTSTGDDAAHVSANYHRLADALTLPRGSFATTWQVHGTRVVRATHEHVGRIDDQADGMVTDLPGLPLTQRFADCTPLLVYDPQRHVIGMGHAGWRGTADGMAAALVQALHETFGSRPTDLVALVGPAIGPCCYEVGAEVTNAVRATLPDAATLLHWPEDHPAERPHFDLWAANAAQLHRAGVAQVEVAGLCTRCHRDTFFSHRGDGPLTGRFGAVMMLK
ncbi:MAG: peptidoglycan editing factor PgeF [Caldilineales bacterium]